VRAEELVYTHPVRESTVETRDGRRLAVTEAGDPNGVPIVFHHGTPGTRSTHNRAPDVLAGARAIFYDRPGYGDSDRQHGRSVSACADDVAAVADALGIDRLAVFGSSGGGPHALATAALLGDRVTRVAVVAGFAPPDDPSFPFLEGMSDLNVSEFQAAFAGEESLADELGAFVEATGSDPDSIIDEIVSELPEPDRIALARPDIRAVFREGIGAAVNGGIGGWIDDDLAFVRPWGFDLASVGQDALLLQGEYDILVPRSHMGYIAAQLRHCRLQIVPGGGHTLFDETRDVVRWLVEGA
jgi:pimeloyl-ACP methyl ester carboxylesterase